MNLKKSALIFGISADTYNIPILLNFVNKKLSLKSTLWGEILTFKDRDFSLPVNVSPEEDTVWLNIEEIGLLFERDRSVIGKHIKSIFNDFELEEKSNVQKMPIANSDKPISLYSLDVIVAVGYRVKSHRGIEFRKWSNYVLKQFIFQKPNELLLQHSECIIDLQNRVTQIEINQKHELKYESGEKRRKCMASSKRYRTLIWQFPLQCFQTYREYFLSKEQDENSVCRFFRHTGPDCKNYNIYYNKEMGMSIGFKINSEIAIEFRKWPIEVINSGLANKYAPFHLKIPFNA